MPKKALENDEIIIDALTDVMERTVASSDSECPFAATGFDRDEFEQSVSTLNIGSPPISEKEMSDLYIRWMELRNIARRQTFTLLNAVDTFLKDQGLNSDEIAEILMDSSHIGRQFGRLSEPRSTLDGGVFDEEFLSKVKHEHDHWFSYDADSNAVDFSIAAKELLKKSYAKHIGCTALGVSVRKDTETINMFDAYWDFFAKNYVDVYVTGTHTYTDSEVYP
jgi:hypothetical protein